MVIGPLYQGVSKSKDCNVKVDQRLISVTCVKEKNKFIDTLLSLDAFKAVAQLLTNLILLFDCCNCLWKCQCSTVSYHTLILADV